MRYMRLLPIVLGIAIDSAALPVVSHAPLLETDYVAALADAPAEQRKLEAEYLAQVPVAAAIAQQALEHLQFHSVGGMQVQYEGDGTIDGRIVTISARSGNGGFAFGEEDGHIFYENDLVIRVMGKQYGTTFDLYESDSTALPHGSFMLGVTFGRNDYSERLYRSYNKLDLREGKFNRCVLPDEANADTQRTQRIVLVSAAPSRGGPSPKKENPCTALEQTLRALDHAAIEVLLKASHIAFEMNE